MAGEVVAGVRAVPNQSPDEIDVLIRAAIAGRRPMTAVYDGLQRVLCPYMLGRNREGRLRLLGYQYSGESGSGLQLKDGHGDWRCFSVEKIGAVRLLDAAWRTADTDSRRPKCIHRIEVQAEGQPEGPPQ
jgi:hypothetical protein